MQRLSSRSTFFYKRVFPVFWFAFIAMTMVVMWIPHGVTHDRADIGLSLVPPVLMAFVGYFIFKRLIFDLVDEVWLAGDYLLVKNRDDQVKVMLDNVMNVSASMMTNPPRISLTLRIESSHLGKIVSFMPAGPGGLFAVFRPNPIAQELIERVDAARRRAA